jgi:hypothetical protein
LESERSEGEVVSIVKFDKAAIVQKLPNYVSIEGIHVDMIRLTWYIELPG